MLHVLRVCLSLYGDADIAQAQGCMSGDLVGALPDEQLQSTCTVILSPVVFMTILLLHDHLNTVPIAVRWLLRWLIHMAGVLRSVWPRPFLFVRKANALLLNASRMWTIMAIAASHVLAPAGACTSSKRAKSLTVRVNPCVPVSNDTCYHRISPR